MKVKKIKKIKEPGENKKEQSILILKEKQIKIEDYLKEWDIINVWLDENPQTINETRNVLIMSANMAIKAKQLYEAAKREKRKYELEYNTKIQPLRTKALEYWELQKENGLRKQVTESMITDRVIESDSKAYITITTKKNEISSIVETLDSLYNAVITKGNDLRKMLDSESRFPRQPKWINN